MNRMLLSGSALSVVALAGCSDATAVRPSPHLLYVYNFPSGQLMAFAVPLTPTSTPLWSVPSPNYYSLTADRDGDLAGCILYSDTAVTFRAPVSSTSQPSGRFSLGSFCIEMAFDWRNRLLNYASHTVDLYDAPLSSGTVSGTEAPGVYSISFSADPSGRLYSLIADSSNVAVYDPPYDTISFQIRNRLQVPLDVTTDAAGNVYILDCCTSRVAVYRPPVTASSDTAFTIQLGKTTFPNVIRVDALGDLITDEQGGGDIHVVPAPLTPGAHETFAIHLQSTGPVTYFNTNIIAPVP